MITILYIKNVNKNGKWYDIFRHTQSGTTVKLQTVNILDVKKAI